MATSCVDWATVRRFLWGWFWARAAPWSAEAWHPKVFKSIVTEFKMKPAGDYVFSGKKNAYTVGALGQHQEIRILFPAWNPVSLWLWESPSPSLSHQCRGLEGHFQSGSLWFNSGHEDRYSALKYTPNMSPVCADSERTSHDQEVCPKHTESRTRQSGKPKGFWISVLDRKSFIHSRIIHALICLNIWYV